MHLAPAPAMALHHAALNAVVDKVLLHCLQMLAAAVQPVHVAAAVAAVAAAAAAVWLLVKVLCSE